MSFETIVNDYLQNPIFEGSRNLELFKAAAAMKDLGQHQSEAFQTLSSKAQADGLKMGEITQTIKSAFDRPISELPRIENSIGKNLAWDDDLGGLLHAPKRKIEIYKAEVPPPASDWENDFKRLCEDAFEPTDIINIVRESRTNEKGKPIPRGKGDSFQVQRVLDSTPEQLQKLIPHNDGAWLRINPLDGQGIADKNVTKFKHVLVESDTLELEHQLSIYKELQLPVSALIHSGGKSIHAWVRVEAENLDQYKKRCAYVYEVLEAQGFEIDHSNKNPSRLSRLVGCMRGDNPQYLVAGRSGQPDFKTWSEWWETRANGLPEIQNFSEIALNPPPLAPVLIDGVLRQGHKLLIGGPSKAGKSFMLIGMSLSLNAGLPWFGFSIKKCSVLYVNFEIDAPSFADRVLKVANKMGVNDFSNLDVWNLRGKSVGIEELAPQIIRKIKQKNYGAVILDPTYKFMGDRDENNAGDITDLMNYLDQISVSSGCSIVLAAHFSKGKQGEKNPTDRISGSGVFGRDPDAIITLSEIKDESNGYKMEGTLREFAAFEPIGLRFNWPIHEIDSALAHENVDGDTSENIQYDEVLDMHLQAVGGDLEAAVHFKEFKTMFNLPDAKLKKLIKKMPFIDGLKLKYEGGLIIIQSQ